MRQSLRYLLVLIILGFSVQVRSAQAQDLTTFILVRHAERTDDGSTNPPLNEAGKQRAQILAEHLKQTNISAIYSTSYIRTKDTVAPVARLKGLKVQEYNPTDPKLVYNILEKERGGVILMAGHSNTTPHMTNQLIGKRRFTQLDESDYSNLFIVTVSEVGKGTAVNLTYRTCSTES